MSKEDYSDQQKRIQDTLRRLSELTRTHAEIATVQDEVPVEFIHAESDQEFQVLYMARRLQRAITNYEFDKPGAAEAQLVINKYIAFDSFRKVLSEEKKAAEVERFVAEMFPFVEMLSNSSDGTTSQS